MASTSLLILLRRPGTLCGLRGRERNPKTGPGTTLSDRARLRSRENLRTLICQWYSFGQLEFCLGQREDDVGLDRLFGCIAHGGQFANQKILCSIEHLLFAERQRLCAAERDQTFEDSCNFHQRSRAHFV